MTPLRLIRGELAREVRLGAVTLQASPAERPPFAIDAVVVEQDTSLLLDEDPVLTLPGESLPQLIEGLRHRQPEHPLGSVLVRRGRPLRLYAVVHDLEREPSWSEAAVESAIDRLFQLATTLQLTSLALPPLAGRHGRLPLERFLALLGQRMLAPGQAWRGRVWLVVPRTKVREVLHRLERIGHDPAPEKEEPWTD